jgi:hypothetical protein
VMAVLPDDISGLGCFHKPDVLVHNCFFLIVWQLFVLCSQILGQLEAVVRLKSNKSCSWSS